MEPVASVPVRGIVEETPNVTENGRPSIMLEKYASATKMQPQSSGSLRSNAGIEKGKEIAARLNVHRIHSQLRGLDSTGWFYVPARPGPLLQPRPLTPLCPLQMWGHSPSPPSRSRSPRFCSAWRTWTSSPWWTRQTARRRRATRLAPLPRWRNGAGSCLNAASRTSLSKVTPPLPAAPPAGREAHVSGLLPGGRQSGAVLYNAFGVMGHLDGGGKTGTGKSNGSTGSQTGSGYSTDVSDDNLPNDVISPNSDANDNSDSDEQVRTTRFCSPGGE